MWWWELSDDPDISLLLDGIVSGFKLITDMRQITSLIVRITAVPLTKNLTNH